MKTQIRYYTINKGMLQQWAKEWRELIKPLREKLGFKIECAYTIEATNQFVWVMSYDGPEDWDKLDRAYHQSDERKAFSPDPGRMLARVEQYFIEPV